MCDYGLAGTAIDYGCFAPVSAFIESFRAIGIEVTPEEARRPMGLTKIDHIRALFDIGADWRSIPSEVWKSVWRGRCKRTLCRVPASAVCYAERVYGSDFRRDRND